MPSAGDLPKGALAERLDGSLATAPSPAELWSDIRLRFLSEMARRLHQYGTTTTRLEASVESLSHKLGLDTQIWSSPTGILLSFRDPSHPEASERRVSEVLRLSPGETNLRRLVDTDEVAERVFHGKMSVSEGYESLRNIQPDQAKFTDHDPRFRLRCRERRRGLEVAAHRHRGRGRDRRAHRHSLRDFAPLRPSSPGP